MYVGMSSYHYARNSPLNFLDPTGMASEAWTSINQANSNSAKQQSATDKYTSGTDLSEDRARYQSIKSSDIDQNGGSSKIGNKVAAIVQAIKRPLRAGYSLACYPFIWSVLKQAYASVGVIPQVLNVASKVKIDKFGDGTLYSRDYPNSNSDFANLFASKSIVNIPANLLGKGAAGAMQLAGLGTLVDNVWSGSLLKGAVLQMWDSNADLDKAKAGQGAEGHVAIFLGYTSINGMYSIRYADQWGNHAVTSSGQVYDVSNTNVNGYVPSATYSHKIVFGSNLD
jgi:hypothetical protein